MRRLALLIAAGTLWLFLFAIPAFADGGPHVAAANSGVSTLTADSCAGCHRAHTAQGEYLIKTATTEALCLNCHGSSGTGASVNVEDGVQYTLASRVGAGTVLGALRNGGFVNAEMDAANPIRVTYPRTATDASFRAKVPVGASAPTTSAHLSIGTSGVVSKNIAWGNGAAGAAAGNASSVSLECTSCHNPHGNGQYRILNTLPSLAGNGFVDPVSLTVNAEYAYTDRFFTSTAHGFIVGDIVTMTGVTGVTDGQYIVTAVPTGTSFKLATAPTKTSADIVTGVAVDVTADVTGMTGTVKRYTAEVDDASLPTGSAERNYTIQQVRGFQGEESSYLLYTNDLTAAAGASAYTLTTDIVGVSASVTISGTPYTDVFTTSLAHGFAVGDTVTIAGLTTNSGANGSQIVASIPSATTFTLTGQTGLTNETAGTAVGAKIGTAAKSVGGTFSATAGDYFHRTVPWNPLLVNPSGSCNTVTPLSTAQTSACLTAQDAPNGRPATVSSTLTVNTVVIKPAAYGQVAFNDQISAWCSTCHTRYYSSTNPNPGSEPSSSADKARTVASVSTITITVSGTLPGDGSTITSTGFSVGDIVTFSQGAANNQYYVVFTGSGGSALTFRVSTTLDGTPVSTGFTGGTVTRLYPGSASSWYFSRPGDSTYKYQHQTTTNRSCVTCHVSHGTSATMATGAGTFSGAVTYPDGSAGTGTDNSRLLKLNNRGTCQMCHDPTGTQITNLGGTLPLTAPALTVP